MFDPGTVVELRKLTWPDKVKAVANFTVLGTDHYGLWVGGLKGNEFKFGDNETWIADVDSVGCLVEASNWNTWFFSEPRRNLYLDIFHSSRWSGTTFEYVDLDLDVLGIEKPEIVDVEELEINSRVNGYPPDLVDEAWRLAKEALKVAEAGAEPIAARGWRWLESLTAGLTQST